MLDKDLLEIIFNFILAVSGALSLVSVLLIICYWRIYSKAGRDGWASLIPIYNNYVFFDVVYGEGWKFLLCFIPVFGQVVVVVSLVRLAQCFNKGVGFGGRVIPPTCCILPYFSIRKIRVL